MLITTTPSDMGNKDKSVIDCRYILSTLYISHADTAMHSTFIDSMYTTEEGLTEIKCNEGGLGHICAHIGLAGPREPPEDGEMNVMTLPSRHRIRNSSPGGLRPSTLPLGHGSFPRY